MALRPDEAEWGRDLPFPPEYEPLDVLPMVVFVRFVFDCEGPAEGQTKFRCLLRSVYQCGFRSTYRVAGTQKATQGGR